MQVSLDPKLPKKLNGYDAVTTHNVGKAVRLDMSYGKLHHSNRSHHSFARKSGSRYPTLRKVTKYQSDSGDSDFDSLNGAETQQGIELKEPSASGSFDKSQADHEARASNSDSSHSEIHAKSDQFTSDEERAVRRKFDRRLVFFVAFLYMLSFLDRSNIGNARVAGMEKDLGLSSSQFEWFLRAFYITYIAFEWMTLLWKIFPAHVYLAICVCSWGVIASLQSLVTSFWSMLLLRALLGIGEAAFVGIPFYMSFFYKRDELAFRTGLFISAAPLATSFAGALAWLIIKFGDAIPIASWRILLLLEGFPSIIVAVFVFRHIPDGPEQAKYLTPRERQVAHLRLREEKDVDARGAKLGKVRLVDIRSALLDPKCYLTAAMFFCCNVAFSSLPVFLPTIIEEMGYSALRSQALSAPPHLVAFVAVLLTAFLSDRYQNRSIFVIFHTFLGCAGYSIMAICGALEASAHWRYAGVYPATIGFFSAITIIITWTLNNQHSSTGRGTSLAILNYVGQLGPLLGVHLYPESDGPFYVKGMTFCAIFMFLVAVIAFGLRIILIRRNKQTMTREVREEAENEGLVPGQKKRKADRFIFIT